ncbi:Serine/threonine-protein phosphatase with EF-hands 1 [Nibea albiflora]|uniref:Serine/threonine-protein phosphatase with EF-hands 1 n=1 Tax=Nibea albiflora TaxID=240163 RepID=A0ACB7FCM0_NIBAL|nr:Serine/threonine-protein phosphatase with EF-hands 1 [Nibea albiflora]
MGCGMGKSKVQLKKCDRAIRAALLIQRWYRQYVARLEMRRRCTWNIFQSIEYAGEQDQIKNEICRDIDWERYFCYRSIEVPDSYTGPHLTFPMTFCGVSKLVEAFKHKQNGLPSSDKPYVFNGDYVDRGKNSLEILLILFGFLLVYPNDVHLNRGNHEDHIVNLRYGFTKEVLGKYRLHGKKILKLLQKIFSWLPLATVIDQKVLISYRKLSQSDSDSDPESGETDEHQWKQIVDMLWSDPMAQDGCVPNEVRGGGCYWGPDVTEEVLGRHNLQLLIRSHECKQEGYEFCHNRRVLTIFSASNYYEVGSNRGAYIRMGSDLVPHFIQYQASRTCRELTLRQSVGWTERSALRALREQLFVHKSDLISAFQEFDPHNTGKISLRNWASATEKVLNLGLPWRVLRPQLVNRAQCGMVDYQQWIKELSITEPKLEVSDNSILETMYKNHSNLETIFRIIDTDHSGLISFEEFHQTWKLLSTHLKMEISDKAIADLAQSIDFNKDGSIDINEFMEAFRLVDLSAHS